jgi:hypothetical protein
MRARRAPDERPPSPRTPPPRSLHRAAVDSTTTAASSSRSHGPVRSHPPRLHSPSIPAHAQPTSAPSPSWAAAWRLTRPCGRTGSKQGVLLSTLETPRPPHRLPQLSKRDIHRGLTCPSPRSCRTPGRGQRCAKSALLRAARSLLKGVQAVKRGHCRRIQMIRYWRPVLTIVILVAASSALTACDGCGPFGDLLGLGLVCG